MERKDILKFKENLDDKSLCSRIHDFMDFVYINDLYEFTINSNRNLHKTKKISIMYTDGRNSI